MHKTLAILAAGGAVLLSSTAALASDFEPAFLTSRAGGFIDMWPAKHHFTTMFGAELQFRVAPRVFLDISMSGAFNDYDVGGGNRASDAAYGNPTAGVHYGREITPRFAFFIGGALTFPLLHDPDLDVASAAYAAAGIRGFYDADRMLPGHMALRAMGGFEWNFVDPLYLRAEVRPVVYVPTRDVYPGFNTDRKADLLLEHAVEFEGRFRNGFGLGARVQGVVVATGNDKAQFVFEPFLSLTPRRRGFWLRAGFPLALDEPLGWGFDEDKLAGVRLALGGQW